VSAAKPVFIKTLATASGAHAFRSLGDKQHIFVSNRAANSISKIDYLSMAVVDTFDVPSGPDCMDLSADGRFLYVGSRWANKLTVVDLTTRTVVRQVKVGKSPHGVWTLDHKPR
jgi:YVTN family beta-propeller protein